jgi:hypothetical protein
MACSFRQPGPAGKEQTIWADAFALDTAFTVFALDRDGARRSVGQIERNRRDDHGIERYGFTASAGETHVLLGGALVESCGKGYRPFCFRNESQLYLRGVTSPVMTCQVGWRRTDPREDQSGFPEVIICAADWVSEPEALTRVEPPERRRRRSPLAGA